MNQAIQYDIVARGKSRPNFHFGNIDRPYINLLPWLSVSVSLLPSSVVEALVDDSIVVGRPVVVFVVAAKVAVGAVDPIIRVKQGTSEKESRGLSLLLPLSILEMYPPSFNTRLIKIHHVCDDCFLLCELLLVTIERERTKQ